MNIMYSKPRLKDLTVGSRIMFVRWLNHLTQEELADALGLAGERKDRNITRYENNNRIPKEERLKQIGTVLKINWECLKEFSFQKPIDFIFYFMWFEELYPNYHIELPVMNYYGEDTIIENFLNEWNDMKLKRDNREISYEQYMHWKLNYKNEGEE